MSEIIPVLELGKARAKEAFLAGSGRVINPSRFADTRQVRYRMGRHRGKTPEQVDEEFQRKWEKASPAIRAKYAKQAGPQSAEVPKGNAELNTGRRVVNPRASSGAGYGAKVEKPSGNAANGARPGESMPDYYKRIGMYPKAEAAPAAEKQTTNSPSTQKTVAQKASEASVAANKKIVDAGGEVNIGTDEERARVAALVNEGGRDATAFVAAPGSANTDGLEDLGMRAAAANAERIKRQENPTLAPVWDEKKKADEAEAARKQAVEAEAAKQTRDQMQAAERERLGLAPATKAPPVTAEAKPSDAARAAKDTAEILARPGNGNSSDPVPVERKVQPAALVPAEKAKYPGQRVDGLTRQSPLADRMNVYAPKAGEELVGMKGGIPQYAPKSAPVVARPTDIAAAEGAMRASGMVVRPTVTPTPKPQQTVAQKPDATVAAQTAAFNRFKQMEANPGKDIPGMKLGQKRPLDELVKRQRMTPVG